MSQDPFQLTIWCCLGRSLSNVGTLAGAVGSWGKSAHFVWDVNRAPPESWARSTVTRH